MDAPEITVKGEGQGSALKHVHLPSASLTAPVMLRTFARPFNRPPLRIGNASGLEGSFNPALVNW
jgi:hypothetical protein